MLGNRMLVALIVTACMAGCDSDLLGPIQAEDVTVSLSVTGGFAGVNWAVVIYGEEGEMRASCQAICAPPGRTLIVPISEAQVGYFASAIEDADVFERAGSDFGTACCDQFEYRLEYHRGGRMATLVGTESEWPTEFRAVLRSLVAIADGRLATLVAFDTEPSDWPTDALTMSNVTLDGYTLTLDATYGGGCAQHPMDLVAWGGWMESQPVQVNVLLTHEDNDDMCDALPTEARSFDLTPLLDAYIDTYGPVPLERATVILRLQGPEGGEPMLLELRL